MRVLIGLAVAGACTAGVRVHAQSSPQIVTLTGTVSMADLVAACEQTASATQAGAVVIKGKLRDANCTATLDVPCAVQLDGRASISLKSCTITSRTLNVSDSASAAGSNAVKLTKVTLVGQGDVGLLIRLTDSRDKINLSDSSADYPHGIVLQALGSRTLPDQGGKVRVKASPLTASGPNGGGVTISASTNRGSVTVSNSTINAPSVVFVADKCRVVTNGKRSDCKAATLAANLARQAHLVTGN